VIESRGRMASVRDEILAVDEQNVGTPVGIGIEERDSGTHGLGQPLLAASARVVGKANARRRRDIGEFDGTVSAPRERRRQNAQSECREN
jgi:hypothetical protein